MYNFKLRFEPEPWVRLLKPVREPNPNLTLWFEPPNRTSHNTFEVCSLDWNTKTYFSQK